MFNFKRPIITFACDESLLGVIPNPIPASEVTPKWYRKMKTNVTPDGMVSTVKRCVPFKDAMDMGYIIPLWLDLSVQNDGSIVNLSYRQPIVQHTLDAHLIEQIQGSPMYDTPYGGQPMKFVTPWKITTAPGWSCLFIQPMNHFDNRLQIISGVVDTDKYAEGVNFPFLWMDKEFNGVIKQGTPLVQVIPFKRTEVDSRVTSITNEHRKILHKQVMAVSSVITNAYRLRYWSPKRYK